jgi:hypothetical protein
VPRFIIHAGIEKTGTTYLQRVFHANYNALAEAGICYPRSGLESQHHYWIAKAFGFRYPNKPVDHEKEIEAKISLRKEIDKTDCHTVLLSSEHFDFNLNSNNVKLLLDFCGASEIILVFRNQLDYAQSLYAEHIKWGGIQSFREFVEMMTKRQKLDFEYRVKVWESNGATVHIVDYDLEKESLLETVLGRCHFDVKLLHSEGLNVNLTPGIDFMELVRQINIITPIEKRRQRYLDICAIKDARLEVLKERRYWQFPTECRDLLVALQAGNHRLAKSLNLNPITFLGGSLIQRFQKLKSASPPNLGSFFYRYFNVSDKASGQYLWS